jgi:NitT/TauT family transport system substrate-binding protein
LIGPFQWARSWQAQSMGVLLAAGLACPALAADATTKVSVAVLYLTSDAGIFIAIERGYFAEQGIEVDLSRTTSLADATALLATDKLDVATGGATPGLFNAFRRGVSAQIVTDKSNQLPPGDRSGGILVRRDLAESGEIKSVSDLKGRRIAVNNIQSTSLNYVVRALAQKGLTKDDVKLVEMPFSQFIPALEKKAVDGVMVYTPLNQTIERMQLARALPEAQLAVTSKGDSFNIMLYSEGFAKTDAAKRFMVAHLKAQRDYQRAVEGRTSMPAICAIIHKYVTAMPADCEGMSFTGIDPDGGVNLASLERYQKEWLTLGVMKEPADVASHVNLEFSRHAAAVLGPFK